VGSAEASYETAEANLLTAVAQTFFAAAISDEILGARQSSIEVARATARDAQTRFAAGAVTRVDVDRAALALVRAEQAEREARFGREQAYRALATLVQAQAAFRVEGLPPSEAPSQPQDLAIVLQLRPEFRAIDLLARSQVAQRRAYAWRWAPGLSAFGNARVFNYDNFARQRHAWAIGLQLDWVLFDGGTRDALRHAAAAQAREAEARAEALRDAIRDELANASALLDTKRYAHEAAERSVVLANETLALVRTQYEAGTIAQLDLLQAQDGLVAAREALAQAHFELAMADLGVRRAAGTFPGK
jgi:outer membrane protein TolC